MKMVYIEDRLSYVEQILNEIDCLNFFKENKLIILSRYPAIDNYNMMYQISPLIEKKLKHSNINGSIMYTALGSLAYIWNDNKFEISNYGPSFSENDFVDFPIKYYQEKEGKKVDSISFYYSPLYTSEYFDMNRLNIYLRKIGSKNNKLYNVILNYDEIIPFYNQQDKMIDYNSRKVVFVPTEGILYGDTSINIKNSEEVLRRYLHDGHFLVLLTYTGAHYGFPFSVDIADVLDTKNHADIYRKMVAFFRSLNIRDDQVSNFKISHIGINSKGGCYNFGFSWDNIEQFFKIYLDDLTRKGYNITEVYLLDYSNKSYTSNNIENIKEQYYLEYISSQDDFNRMVKHIHTGKQLQK